MLHFPVSSSSFSRHGVAVTMQRLALSPFPGLRAFSVLPESSPLAVFASLLASHSCLHSMISPSAAPPVPAARLG